MIRVRLGSVYHYGIFVSEAEVIAFGLPPLPEYRENGEEIKVLATSIDVFSCGKIIETPVFDRKERKQRFSREKTLSIARGRIGEDGYSLIHNNCEHFVYECVFGVSRSTVEEEMRARYRARKVLDLYLGRLPDQAQSGEVTPDKRRKEIEKCKDPLKKRRKTADWNLLMTGQAHTFGEDFGTLRFRKSIFGKWSCDRFFFSLAAGGDYIAAALSNAPVGVDLEQTDSFLASGKAKHFTKSVVTAETLADHTARQAIFKREGKGRFSPEKTDPAACGTVSFEFEEFPGLILSAAGESCRFARVFFVSEEGELRRLRPKTL